MTIFEEYSAVGLLKYRYAEMKWISDMAHKGISANPEEGDSPYNVFLYMIDCELQKIEKQLADEEAHQKEQEDDEDSL